MFQQLLREETIKVGLKAEDRKAAFKEMIALLPQWGIGEKERENLYRLLLEREKFGTTAIGEGIALPHCILPDIEYPLASLGISRTGIHYPSLDGNPVQIIFMAIFPAQFEDSEINKRKILHSAEIFFRDRFLRERLKISETPEEAYEILLREGNRLQEIERRHPQTSKAVGF